MYKIITNSFNFNAPSLTIISDNLVKTASCHDDDFLKDVQTQEGYTKVLALFLGAGEYYGCNQNGDYFTEEDLRKYYPTFVKHGKVYMHHENKNPDDNYGYVEKCRYNEKMKRVEGVMCLKNDRCSEYIEKLDRGENIPVSMACRVKFDVCSICANKARTTKEYCVHLKYDLKKIYDDSRMVYAINPDPIFIDISIVFRPADKTAYTLKKVASYGRERVIPSAEIAEAWGYIEKSASHMHTKNILEKMSELEKTIEPILVGNRKQNAKDVGPVNDVKEVIEDMPDFDDETICRLKEFPFEKTLKSLSDKNMMLSLKDFLKFTDHEDMFDEVRSILPSSMSRLLNVFDDVSDKVNFDISNTKDDHHTMRIKDILKNFVSEKSITPENVKDKILHIRIHKKPKVERIQGDNGVGVRSSSGSMNVIIKKSNKKSVAADLCNLYNLYKVSCINHGDNLQILSAVVSNYV